MPPLLTGWQTRNNGDHWITHCSYLSSVCRKRSSTTGRFDRKRTDGRVLARPGALLDGYIGFGFSLNFQGNRKSKRQTAEAKVHTKDSREEHLFRPVFPFWGTERRRFVSLTNQFYTSFLANLYHHYRTSSAMLLLQFVRGRIYFKFQSESRHHLWTFISSHIFWKAHPLHHRHHPHRPGSLQSPCTLHIAGNIL